MRSLLSVASSPFRLGPPVCTQTPSRVSSAQSSLSDPPFSPPPLTLLSLLSATCSLVISPGRSPILPTGPPYPRSLGRATVAAVRDRLGLSPTCPAAAFVPASSPGPAAYHCSPLRHTRLVATTARALGCLTPCLANSPPPSQRRQCFLPLPPACLTTFPLCQSAVPPNTVTFGLHHCCSLPTPPLGHMGGACRSSPLARDMLGCLHHNHDC